MTTPTAPTAPIRHSIPDDAPATAFAPCPGRRIPAGLRGPVLRQRLVRPLSAGQPGSEGVRSGACGGE